MKEKWKFPLGLVIVICYGIVVLYILQNCSDKNEFKLVEQFSEEKIMKTEREIEFERYLSDMQKFLGIKFSFTTDLEHLHSLRYGMFDIKMELIKIREAIEEQNELLRNLEKTK